MLGDDDKENATTALNQQNRDVCFLSLLPEEEEEGRLQFTADACCLSHLPDTQEGREG